MASEESHQDRLHWTGGWSLSPVWPREPDLDIVRLLAKRYLVEEFSKAPDDAQLDVRFFAEGGFNKLYEISCTGHHQSYLLRAALSVVPYYKTESEVATIAFLRTNTTIPVPRVLAWDSNRDNELTFEWILMEKLPGAPISDLWPRKVPWERKLELTQSVAGMIKQLRECTFDRIGGLYFHSAVAHLDCQPEKTTEPTAVFRSLPVTKLVGERLEEHIAEPTNEYLDEFVNWLVDMAVMVSTGKLLDARNEATPTDASSTTKFLDVESLHHDARSTSEAKSSLIDSQSIIDDDRRGLTRSVPCDSLGCSGDGSTQGVGITGQYITESSERSEAGISTDSATQADVAIGPIFDHLFFIGSRLYLPGDRGPYKTASEWLSAQIQVQLEWIKNALVEDGEEYDEDFVRDSPMMEKMCCEFLDLLQVVCGDEETPASYTLHHHDLNEANILINPETFEVTGIVDWEMINVVPKWRAAEGPRFLEYMEPDDQEEPPIPSSDVNENSVSWELRDRWEHKVLRRRFDEIVQTTAGNDRGPAEDPIKAKVKRDYQEQIPNLTDEWTWSEAWLKKYKTTGKSVNRADRTNSQYLSDEEA